MRAFINIVALGVERAMGNYTLPATVAILVASANERNIFPGPTCCTVGRTFGADDASAI
jgi:hypothetical protein